MRRRSNGLLDFVVTMGLGVGAARTAAAQDTYAVHALALPGASPEGPPGRRRKRPDRDTRRVISRRLPRFMGASTPQLMRLRLSAGARPGETFRVEIQQTLPPGPAAGRRGTGQKGAEMSRQTRVLIAVAGVLLAVAAFAAEGAATIERFYRISERVAVGGQPTPEQVVELSHDGFNGVINLREEVEFNDGPQARAARDWGMTFVRVPVSREAPSDEAVDKFLVATDDPAMYPIYIYCGTGNRAAAFWMIRRVVRDGWTVADAEAEAGRAGLSSGKMLDFARDYVQRHPKNAGTAS